MDELIGRLMTSKSILKKRHQIIYKKDGLSRKLILAAQPAILWREGSIAKLTTLGKLLVFGLGEAEFHAVCEEGTQRSMGRG